MATPEQIGIRREAALGRLTAATDKIAEALGIDIAEFPTQGKDQVALQADQIVWTADHLEAIAKKAAKLADRKALIEKADDARAAAKQAESERDDARAQIATDAAHADALQRLAALAASDDWVRMALVKAGFIQAKQDADGGDWSVSVVGVGPDLEPTAQPNAAPDAPESAETSEPAQPDAEPASDESDAPDPDEAIAATVSKSDKPAKKAR